jgi:hypothetical protein
LPSLIEKIKALQEQNIESSSTGFKPFPVDYLYKLSSTPVDLYLQLSSEKFIKFHHANHEFTIHDINRIKDKGMLEVFTKENEILPLLKEYLSKLQDNLQQDSRSEKVKHSDFGKLCDLIFKNMKELRIDPELLENSQKMITRTFDELKNSNGITKAMSNLLKNSNNHVGHSIAVAFIASALCHEGPWSSAVNKKKVSATLKKVLHL